MSAEKKQYKEQRDEAERFQTLIEEKGAVITQQYLTQLFHIEQGIQCASCVGKVCILLDALSICDSQ